MSGAPKAAWAGLTSAAASARVAALRAAAKRGNVESQLALARVLKDGAPGVPANPAEAARWYRTAAEGGSVHAMGWMSDACHLGAPGVPVDLPTAFRWAMRAAEKGSAACQCVAGTMLLSGEGVAVDEAAGVAWLRRAADAGFATAQYNLHCSYRQGTAGLRPDDPAALPLLWSAAEGGLAVAQNDLGRRLLWGISMPKDTVAGVAMLRRAVEGGSMGGCANLGDAHAKGLGGLPVDVAAARALYERVASSSSHIAAHARRKLHELPADHAPSPHLPAAVAPVCALVSCGAALNAGTLSGLCADCRGVRYCGSSCQRAGWRVHKAVCQAATAARKAAAASAPSSTAAPGTSPTPALLAQRAEVETWARMPLDALQQAAEAGEAAAQAALGSAYVDGVLGLTKDEAAGVVWLRKAAAGGLLPPRVRLARVAVAASDAAGPTYATALSEEAACWARPAAEAGDAEAQVRMYVSCSRLAEAGGGPAATAHWAEAARWLRLALAQGDRDAMEEMAQVAWLGHAQLGVARDRVEARRLFAATNNVGMAMERRARRPAGAPGSAQ